MQMLMGIEDLPLDMNFPSSLVTNVHNMCEIFIHLCTIYVGTKGGLCRLTNILYQHYYTALLGQTISDMASTPVDIQKRTKHPTRSGCSVWRKYCAMQTGIQYAVSNLFLCHGLRVYPVCVCKRVRLGQDTT